MDIFSVNNNLYNDKESGEVIGWWSGGVASAITCFLSLEMFDDLDIVFCDTHAEHPDTYRFMDDFERTLGVTVKKISHPKFHEPEDVWRKYVGLNFAHGAPCSSTLKRSVREKYQDIDNNYAQAFGFDYCKKEMKRAENMMKNYPEINPVFPLLIHKYDRLKIFEKLEYLGIKPPVTYEHFLNNNCIGDFDSPKGGCVQGGIGYWQKIKALYPHKYEYMANIEHELSEVKGEPVTICKDQRRQREGNRMFLMHNPAFPDIECIDVILGKQPETMFECNGFCGTQIDLFK